MATYCIYKLTNMITLMAYVGKTDDFDDRMRKHRNPKQSPNMLITKAIVLHGWENFDVEILIDNVPETVDENYYIEREKTRAPHGYNQRRGAGSGCVSFDKQHKKWVVYGPEPETKFVGRYFTEEKANEALDLFRRTGERMASDITMRRKGTGSIHVTNSGRWEARITVKGKLYSGTFDTWDEADAFCIRIKNTYS